MSASANAILAMQDGVLASRTTNWRNQRYYGRYDILQPNRIRAMALAKDSGLVAGLEQIVEAAEGKVKLDILPWHGDEKPDFHTAAFWPRTVNFVLSSPTNPKFNRLRVTVSDKGSVRIQYSGKFGWDLTHRVRRTLSDLVERVGHREGWDIDPERFATRMQQQVLTAVNALN